MGRVQVLHASGALAKLPLVALLYRWGVMTEVERLAFLEQQAEVAYDAMYEAHSRSHASACYSDAKEALYSAITIAQELRAEML